MVCGERGGEDGGGGEGRYDSARATAERCHAQLMLPLHFLDDAAHGNRHFGSGSTKMVCAVTSPF